MGLIRAASLSNEEEGFAQDPDFLVGSGRQMFLKAEANPPTRFFGDSGKKPPCAAGSPEREEILGPSRPILRLHLIYDQDAKAPLSEPPFQLLLPERSRRQEEFRRKAAQHLFRRLLKELGELRRSTRVLEADPQLPARLEDPVDFPKGLLPVVDPGQDIVEIDDIERAGGKGRKVARAADGEGEPLPCPPLGDGDPVGRGIESQDFSGRSRDSGDVRGELPRAAAQVENGAARGDPQQSNELRADLVLSGTHPIVGLGQPNGILGSGLTQAARSRGKEKEAEGDRMPAAPSGRALPAEKS